MMNNKILAATIAASMGTAGIGVASAASIGSMTVTDGSFGMGYFTYGGFVPFTGIGSDNDISQYSSFSGNNIAQPTGSGGV